MTGPATNRGGHLDELLIAAYLDRRVPIGERERVEEHLASCSDCREDLVQAHRVLLMARRRRRVRVAGSILASAALVLIVVQSIERGRGAGARASPLRTVGDSPSLVAHEPNGPASLSSLQFVWSAAGVSASYHLTVTRADGGLVWAGSTTDTVMTVPDSIALRPGERYFWFVDALLRDGATRSTGPREFQPIR